MAAILLQLWPAAGLAQESAGPGSPLENFGRWERSLSQCRISGSDGSGAEKQAGTSSQCVRLRLDQQLPGLLSLRFVTVSGRSSYGSRELMFAGVLERDSRPMLCQSGLCQPRGPLKLQVTAVAVAGFDGRGLAGGVPRAILARGQCVLERHEVRCSATAADGERWSAVADL